MEHGWCDADGVSMHYLAAGDPADPTVVLLHGGVIDCASLSWGGVVDRLAENRRVIAPDLVGYGESDRPDVSYSTAWHVDVVESFLDLVGTSQNVVSSQTTLDERFKFARVTGDSAKHDDQQVGRDHELADEDVLALQGGYESPMRFEPAGEDRLRLIGGDTGSASGSAPDDALQRSASFEPIRPELRMRGMYSYLADAATFMECRTGRRMPVAREAANDELETGYLDADPAPGQGLLAVITGRIVQRPPMDGGPEEPTVVPLAFHAVWPGETCGTPFSRAELEDTYWKLTRMGDEAIIPIAEAREPHIVLNVDGRMAGSDGCNQLSASYEIDGDTIGFGEIATTRMACPQGEEQARQFREALERASRYRVVGSHLELFNEAGEMLARFEAVYLE